MPRAVAPLAACRSHAEKDGRPGRTLENDKDQSVAVTNRENRLIDNNTTFSDLPNPSGGRKAFVHEGAFGFSLSFGPTAIDGFDFAQRDRRDVERAAERLSLLTLDEIEILSAFGCFHTADTRSTRSWRGRLLTACAALRRIEPSLIPAAVELAQVRRRKIDALFADGEDRWLVSPFTAVSRGSEAE